MKTRTLTLAAAGVAAALLIAGPAGAKPKPGKDDCKNGGYASLTSRVGGAPFASQGECMSFAAKGGTLVPVSAGGEL
jgi:hypothetical protein